MRSLQRHFAKDTDGTVAVNFALGLTAILALIGAAIDLSLVNSQKNKMQNLADSTALAAAVSGHATAAELQVFAEDFMKSSTLPDANVKVKLNGGNILVELTKSKELLISQALPGGKADLFADSEVALPGTSNSGASGDKKYNIALVLDTTNSMRSAGRMDALKTAATNFLTAMEDNGSPENMVSLVPFSNYVRIPTSNENKAWIEVPTKSTETGIFAYSTGSWQGCMNSRPDGFHTSPDFNGRRLQAFWEGDRCGEKYNNQLAPLSKDFDGLKTEINSWIPEGGTYIPSGLIWGWRTLSPNAPFTESEQRTDAKNVMILMSDGSNTLSVGQETKHSNGVYHKGVERTTSDKREAANVVTLELCDGIKAQGIRIVTLTFKVTDQETRGLLQNCASSSNDYYPASDGTELLDSFNKIEGDLNADEEHVVRLIR